MTDIHQPLRDALKAGPTGGKWRKTSTAEVMIGTRRLCNVNAAESLALGKDIERANINAAYIAAANPAAISALLADLDAAVEMLQGVLKIERGSSGRIILEGWHEETIKAALSQIKAGREQA